LFEKRTASSLARPPTRTMTRRCPLMSGPTLYVLIVGGGRAGGRV
jgi:hypothetical protein